MTPDDDIEHALEHLNRALVNERDASRLSLLHAMRRMLSGQPLRAPVGTLTVVALAEEAQVPRSMLNRKYTDLRDLFQSLAAQRDLRTPREKELLARLDGLSAEVAKSRERYVSARTTADQWKAAAEALARLVQAREVIISRLEDRVRLLERRAGVVHDALAQPQTEVAYLPSRQPKRRRAPSR